MHCIPTVVSPPFSLPSRPLPPHPFLTSTPPIYAFEVVEKDVLSLLKAWTCGCECVCMVLQKVTRELAIVLLLTWLYRRDAILRMDAKLHQILPFLWPCFPPTASIIFDTHFIFQSFWIQLFTPMENNATREIRERGGRGEMGGDLLEDDILSFQCILNGLHISPEENWPGFI